MLGFLAHPMGALGRLAAVIVSSLRLRHDAEWSVPLDRTRARRLYEVIEDIARRVGIDPPDSIVLQMNVNAGVSLHGYRQGKGKCKLYIGYDLLAVLSEGELEAVMAHEMAHAKLIYRGFYTWVSRGVARICSVANALNEITRSTRRFYTASAFRWFASLLAATAARLYAACARQEEFNADRMAAEICGAEAVRSGLVMIAAVSRKAQRVDWRDRLLATQQDRAFAEWLRSQLVPTDDEREEIEQKIAKPSSANRFDSHPSYSDRIASLPPVAGEMCSAAPALSLLDDPEEIAHSFVREMEKMAAEHEKKDTAQRVRRAKNIARSSTGSKHITAGQGCMAVIIGFGLVLSVIAILLNFYDGNSLNNWYMLAICLSVSGLGILAFRKLGFKERNLLPVPEFGVWQKAREDWHRRHNTEEWPLRIKSELLANPPQGRKSARARAWTEICYEALAVCDYERASVAAGLCLEAKPDCFEGLLTAGISAAYFQNDGISNMYLNRAFKKYRLGFSLSWALGWTFALLKQWNAAETYLLSAIANRPDEPTVVAVLGISQAYRGKAHEAIENAHRALSLSPDNSMLRLSLVKGLLFTGRAKEAEEELMKIGGTCEDSLGLALCDIHTDVLLGRIEQANIKSAHLVKTDTSPLALQSLAHIYMDSGREESCRCYLEQLCEIGYYPDAYMRLARLEYANNNNDKARDYLLSSLDMTRQPGEYAAKPVEVMQLALTGLISLGEQVDGCGAWMFTVNMPKIDIDRISFLACAPTLEDARAHVEQICSAMQPGIVIDSSVMSVRKADAADQPIAPVVPGVYSYKIG